MQQQLISVVLHKVVTECYHIKILVKQDALV